MPPIIGFSIVDTLFGNIFPLSSITDEVLPGLMISKKIRQAAVRAIKTNVKI
jgi:hypothetical protein